ncbi:NAD(P)H-quinone oxidoreductase subunit 2, chloroplastic [Pseudoalteromonas sp. CIP111854]|uniref:Probable inorganic carbon transporter subunit DabB n=1 Tax=Pseudoalteromonas holothuriae TaxID=2963714 RepID=A0A9W4W0P9_9GAMM|nr:NADH-quinone oxidoreductase subunit L [Pseudoalteromonas sp. CIP111854]CAH9050308.1 NAD(P)H-quinone oxidoreductase subunit 2, chloroplastic [Pseudoalteromonas sp. CIP111854]
MLEYFVTALLLLVPLAPMIIGFWSGWTVQNDTLIAKKALLCLKISITSFAVLAAISLFSSTSITPDLWRLTPLTWVITTLVLGIGFVVTRFSRQYMYGEPRLGYYYRWLLLTLSAVLITVLANNLLLLLFGWVLISLSLHRLLVFYPNRARTQLAAHKKFIIARISELSLALAFWLLYEQAGSANITTILNMLQTGGLAPSTSLTLAACFIALTAILKCAQLPVHGWLIQVVDAPTPVSALLHAGVINLGGYLLILFSPVMQQSPLANSLLLGVAGISLLLSALIMQTRVSIKVKLAWSTSAQMGFMLVECALGFYELALLHLVAHSLYKAHAFLFAGSTVQQYQHVLLAQQNNHSYTRLALSAMAGGMLVFGASLLVHSAWSLWLLLGIGLSLHIYTQAYSIKNQLVALAGAVLMTALIVTWKLFASSWFGLPEVKTVSIWADMYLIIIVIALLVLTQALSKKQKNGATSGLQNAFFAGLYLDEWFTRFTQRVWPINLTPANMTHSHNAK